VLSGLTALVFNCCDRITLTTGLFVAFFVKNANNPMIMLLMVPVQGTIA
jgi:hypothetical protein